MKQYKIIKGLRTDAALQTTQKNTLPSYYAEQGVIEHTYKKISAYGLSGQQYFWRCPWCKKLLFRVVEQREFSGFSAVESTPSGHTVRQLGSDADIIVD